MKISIFRSRRHKGWKRRPLILAVDGQGNVYVTGDSGGNYVTIKYVQVP